MDLCYREPVTFLKYTDRRTKRSPVQSPPTPSRPFSASCSLATWLPAAAGCAPLGCSPILHSPPAHSVEHLVLHILTPRLPNPELLNPSPSSRHHHPSTIHAGDAEEVGSADGLLLPPCRCGAPPPPPPCRRFAAVPVATHRIQEGKCYTKPVLFWRDDLGAKCVCGLHCHGLYLY